MNVIPFRVPNALIRYHFFDVVREQISHMDDGEKDEYEMKWDEDAEFAHNDVQLCQSFPFMLAGPLMKR